MVIAGISNIIANIPNIIANISIIKTELPRISILL